MRWVGLAVLTLAAAAVGTRLLLARRGGGTNLGSVSDRWIAQHRADAP